MLGAAAPVGKISSLGKAASKLDDEVKVLGYFDELGNFIKTEGDDVIRNAGECMAHIPSILNHMVSKD